jgi:hypothetical protein
MVREEIKRAAQDGKTKLQFPTGETAMKIEGLGESHGWYSREQVNGVTPDKLKVGMNIRTDLGVMGDPDATEWIIADVLGDGKFKAVPKEMVERFGGDVQKAVEGGNWETFDISGKVDTNNPIYKFYEKDLGRYLKNNFNAKNIIDDKGVSWMELDIKPEMAKKPVMAFGKMATSPLFAIAGATALGVGLKRGSDYLSEKFPYKWENEELKNKTLQPKVDFNKLKDAIAHNESRGESKPYQFRKFSGSKAMGEDLGKYQITTEELRVYSKRFIGKQVTPDEFIASPELQDQYILGKIKNLSSRGLTPEEILAVHRSGMSDLTRESLNRKLKERADYVKSGLLAYNK